MGKIIELDGRSLTLEALKRIGKGEQVNLNPQALGKVKKTGAFIVEKVKDEEAVYGINTGFGYFARTKIAKEKRLQLQHNLLVSHAAGYGPFLEEKETRAAMALRLNVLMKGLAGVSAELCEKLCQLLNRGIHPCIPEMGSVGASGDLAPLAHLALPLIGEGKVTYRGSVLPAAEALKKEGIAPYVLREKEGLSLINGTQIMLAVGGGALADISHVISVANLITGLTAEAFVSRIGFLHPKLHEERGHSGQIYCAREIQEALEGSFLLTTEPRFVQDPYSLRCAPQVHGPSKEALDHVLGVVAKELNAATDNPLVFIEEEKIVSGGNFHGQPLAMAFDFAAIALAELGNISERRLELLLNPHLSGLSAFLTDEEGIESGYMALQYLSGSCVNENKVLANPACTDSIPGNVGIEDHVSMGMTSARKLKKIADNLATILTAELLAACRAIDLRGLKPLGKKTKKVYEALRSYVPAKQGDRNLSDEVFAGRPLVETYLAEGF